MKHGVSIYGGFPHDNDNAAMADRNPTAHVTTLRGNGSSVIVNNNNGLAAADILDGFTLTGGDGLNGGGIYNYNSSPTLTHVIISGNTSDIGGGIYNYNSSPILTHVTISGNTSDIGGGIYNDESSPTLTHVTISGNTAGSGEEWYNHSGIPVIRNSIIYGNGVNGHLYDIKNSLIQNQAGNTEYEMTENNNLATATDPLFTDPTNGNYTLKAGSPAINKGNNDFYTAAGGDLATGLDLAGNPRVADGTVDMGTYEFQGDLPGGITPDANKIVYVKQGATGNGSSWAHATGDFQGAVDAAGAEQVWVATGTYQPAQWQSFTMKHGVSIYGGFPDDNDNAAMADRNPTAHVTTLRGNGNSVVRNDYNGLTAADILDGFTLTGGDAEYGGGIYNRSSSPTLTHVIISGNTASEQGGGIYNRSSSPILTDVTISGNTANYGGGIYNVSSSSTLTHIIISGNTAENQGGGIYNSSFSSLPTLTHVTIGGNTAGAGQEWYNSIGTPIIRNSIIYGNGVAGQLYDVKNSLVQGQGGNTEYEKAENENLPTATDPLFTDPANGNYTLKAGSPAINKGNNDFYTAAGGDLSSGKDLAGNPRVADGTVDMGAYEFQGDLPGGITPDANKIVYVKQGATGNGSSWATATGDFQGAVDAAGAEQVWVAAGTYQPAAGQAFSMKHGVSIYGGFPDDNDNAALADRNRTAHVTTLRGNGNSVVRNDNNGLTAADILDGFTLTGGDGLNGGGIYNYNSSPTLTYVIISGNTAYEQGGGIYNNKSSSTLTHVIISGNTAGDGGGGIYNYNSSPTLTYVIISGNTANLGGGIHNLYSSPTLTHVIISGNTAAVAGGIYNNSSSPILTHITISGNTAGNGEEWYNNSGIPIIRNSIIYGNGVAGHLYDTKNSLIQNQAGNTEYEKTENNNLATATDPLFTDPANGDYSLKAGSPAINKGNNDFYTAAGGDPASGKDLAGNPRVADGAVDMGTYEFQGDAPGGITPDVNKIVYVKEGATGNGSSWAHATGDFQGAVNATGAEQVWVATGTYQPAAGQAFSMKHGVSIYGGFPDDNDNATMTDRNPTAHVTTLRGNGNSVIVNDNNGLTAADILDGFTITGGDGLIGGGIANNSSSPNLTHVIISGNTADLGGGIHNSYSSPTLTHVTISGNTANYGGGGGVYNHDSSPTLTHVVISGNTAVGNGGGIYNYESSLTLTHVIISGNTAENQGGGIYNYESSPTLTHVTIGGNTAGSGGNGIILLAPRLSAIPLSTVTVLTGICTMSKTAWSKARPAIQNTKRQRIITWLRPPIRSLPIRLTATTP